MDNVVRKRFSLIFCFVFVITTLCGCNVFSGVTDLVNRKKEIEAISNHMMQCIVDDNRAELLSLFSADRRKNNAQQISEEIEKASKFIKGRIISYEYAGLYGESEKTNYGKVKFYDCSPKFLNVVTNMGAKYEIKFAYIHTWKEKPECEGISEIRIMDADDHSNYVEIGFFYDDL